MKQNSLIQTSFLNAFGVFIYVNAVAKFMFYAEPRLGKMDDTFLAPVTFLLLLVISATVVGSLIIGKPIMWYLDGKKKEAMSLLMYTVGWLVFFFALIVGYFLVK